MPSTSSFDAVRALAGFALAAAIAGASWRLGTLSLSGAIAATFVGAIAVAAGWSWSILLVAFFVASSLLSRYRAREKALRTGAVVAKSGRRDAVQVVANGAPFALAAILALVHPAGPWASAGAGALAAATSDTWATEFGTLTRAAPRSIRNGRVVPPGTSGGITAVGLAGAFAGATFLGGIVLLLGWDGRTALAVVVGGLAGSTLDSLLGATAQAGRWCGSCGIPTERAVHDCGVTTMHVHGARWIDNDVVNLAAGFAGAAVAILFSS